MLDRKTGNPKYRAFASTFTDRRTAQEAVNRIMSSEENQREIATWLVNGGRGSLALGGHVGKIIGHGIRRADLLAGHLQHIQTASVRVILQADSKFPEGYKILTAFPDIK